MGFKSTFRQRAPRLSSKAHEIHVHGEGCGCDQLVKQAGGPPVLPFAASGRTGAVFGSVSEGERPRIKFSVRSSGFDPLARGQRPPKKAVGNRSKDFQQIDRTRNNLESLAQTALANVFRKTGRKQLREGIRDALESKNPEVAVGAIPVDEWQAELQRELSVLYARAIRRGWKAQDRAAPKRIQRVASRDPFAQPIQKQADEEFLDNVISGTIPVENQLLLARIQEFIGKQTAELVTLIGQETEKAIRQAVQNSINVGLQPVQLARGLRAGVSRAAFSRELTLIDAAVGLNLPQQRALINFRNRLQDAGLSQDRIAAQVKRRADVMFNKRMKTIARTEMQFSLQRGKSEYVKDQVDKGTIDPRQSKRFWIVSLDEVLCQICTDIARSNPDGVDLDEDFASEFLGSVFEPPAHPNCRCDVRVRYVPAEDRS